jgi:hypothetical protein
MVSMASSVEAIGRTALRECRGSVAGQFGRWVSESHSPSTRIPEGRPVDNTFFAETPKGLTATDVNHLAADDVPLVLLAGGKALR